MKIIGQRLNHKKMRDMIGHELYLIKKAGHHLIPLKCLIIGIKISENNKWEFQTDIDDLIGKDEPLFINEKSLKRYAKKYLNTKM